MASNVLKSLFSRKLNMDVTLKVEGDERELQAHRLILSGASKYFEDIFNAEILEQDSNPIALPVMNFETLEAIVTYFYTEEWTFGEKCSPTMAIIGSDYLLAEFALESLSHLVKNNITTENVIELFCVSDKISKDTKDCLARFISLHIGRLDELPTLNVDQFLYILKMYPGDTQTTLTAIQKWVLSIPDERCKFAFQLLSFVVFTKKIETKFIITEIVPICKDEKSLSFVVALFARMFSNYSDAFVNEHLAEKNVFQCLCHFSTGYDAKTVVCYRCNRQW